MQEETTSLLGAMRNGDDTSQMARKKSSSMSAPTGAGIEMDSGERRLNELGYKQELRREMVIASLTCLPFHCKLSTPLYCATCAVGRGNQSGTEEYG